MKKARIVEDNVERIPQQPPISHKPGDSNTSAISRMDTSIFSLCPEIMVHIFGFLDTADKCAVAQVCTTWWSVVYLPCLWRNTEVQLKDARVNPVLNQSLSTRRIYRVAVHSTKILVETVWGMPQVHELWINLFYEYDLRNDVILQVAFTHQLPLLTTLKIWYCEFELTDDLMALLADNVQNLLCLELCECSVNERTTWPISRLTKLKTLSIFRCTVSIDRLVTSLPLEHLSFQFCNMVTDNTLRLISLNLHQLCSINLARSGRVTDRGLRHLANLDKLCSINLDGQVGITNSGMLYLASMASLRDISLYCCPIFDDGLAILANGGSGLVNLSLARCMVTDVGLRHLAKLGKLCMVDVSECERVTDVGVGVLKKRGVECIH